MNVAYVEPSRRPDDGRYGDNPNRLYQHHQFQVIMKPSPNNIQETSESLKELGIDPEEHDIRFIKTTGDPRRSAHGASAGKSGSDGMEITQFTYFQQVGGIDERPVAVECAYSTQRIAMYIQEKDDVMIWNGLTALPTATYGMKTNMNSPFTAMSFLTMICSLSCFDMYEKEATRVVKKGFVLPAYDYVLKCSHAFNLLDAAGAISLSERTEYIARVRNMAECAPRNG